MNLPTIDLSTVLFLFYFIAVLLATRGLTTHMRDSPCEPQCAGQQEAGLHVPPADEKRIAPLNTAL